MKRIESLARKIKKSRSRAKMLEALDELVETCKEQNEILRLQLAATQRERDDYKKELEEIHASISYRIGRWIAETRVGGWFKKLLRKYV